MAQGTLTELINQSLGKLGHNNYLNSIDDDTTLANNIRQYVPQTIDTVQSEFTWQELVREITQATSEDSNGRRFIQIPSDSQRIMDVRGIRRYEVMDNKIFIDSTPPAPQYVYNPATGESEQINSTIEVTLVYIKRSMDVGKWTSQLAECFIYQLAIDISGIVKQDPNVGLRLSTYYQSTVLPNARRLQSYRRQGSYQTKRVFRNVSSRYNGRRTRGL